MSDPIGFMAEGSFDDIEYSEGIAGQALVDPQWAVLSVQGAEARRVGAKQSHCLTVRVKVEKGLTPGKTGKVDLWLSGKNQGAVDGLCVAVGLSPLTVRFGEPTGERDHRAQVTGAEADASGKLLAAALSQNRSFIGCIGVEESETFGDKNRFQGMHRLTQENEDAIVAAGFSAVRGAVVVKKRDEGGKKKSYLTAGGGKAATPTTGTAGSGATVVATVID